MYAWRGLAVRSRRACRQLVGCVAFAAMLALAAPCSADPSVRWVAPPRCPQEPAFVRALEREFRNSDQLQQLRTVEGHVTRSDTGMYELTLSAQHAERADLAVRRLSSYDCAELVPAAVWLIVLAAYPAAQAPAGKVTPSLAAASTTTGVTSDVQAAAEGSGSDAGYAASAEGERSSPEPVSAAPALHLRHDRASAVGSDTLTDGSGVHAKTPLHVRVAGLGGVLAGAGVPAQGTIGVAASLSLGILHTQASLIDALPAEHTIAQVGHVHLWSLAVGLSECALWGQRVSLGPCGGLALLRTSAHSRDFGYDAQRVVLWGMLELGARLLWKLGKSFELSLAGGVGTPLTPRPRFTVGGAGPVASATQWSEVAQLGLYYVIH
jgi:hypothetical protein